MRDISICHYFKYSVLEHIKNPLKQSHVCMNTILYKPVPFQAQMTIKFQPNFGGLTWPYLSSARLPVSGYLLRLIYHNFSNGTNKYIVTNFARHFHNQLYKCSFTMC